MAYIIIILLTYFMEMLISYAFFSQIGERKVPIIKCMLIGFLMFESGALINLSMSNIIWLNALCFFIINLSFGFICYQIKITRLILYFSIFSVQHLNLQRFFWYR